MDNPPRLYCKLCKVYCSSLPNLKQHYDSKQHAKKTTKIINKGDETDSTITGSVDKTDDMEFCEVCDKRFSGPENAVAHYNSKKHKNKVCMSSVGTTLLSCSPCSKKFCTKELLQQHCETDKHKKKVEAIEKMKNFAYCQGIPTESLNQETESGVAVTSNPSEVDETEAEIIKTTLKCSACNKTFSGISNANDHLNSSKHKKLLLSYKEVATKPENCVSVSNNDLINFEDTISQTVLATLKCSACDKTFTGIAPVNDHLKSSKHKRNVQSAKLKVAIAVDSFLPLVKGDLANQLGIHMGANPNASTEISSSVNQDEIRPVVDLVKPDIQPVVEEGGNDDIQPVVEEGGNDDIQPVIEEGSNDDIRQILENDAVIEVTRTANNENRKRECENLELQAAKKKRFFFF